MITREKLLNDYLEYINNYLTIAVFAEHRELYVHEAKLLIELGKSCLELTHPEE